MAKCIFKLSSNLPQRSSQRGMALVIVFMLMILLASFAYSVFYLNYVTTEFTESLLSSDEAGYYAKAGVNYFIHKMASLDLSSRESILPELNQLKNKKINFEGKNGWFRLDYVEKVKEDYLLRISGGIDSQSTAKQPYSLWEKVYGDSQTWEVQYEVLIGPKFIDVPAGLIIKAKSQQNYQMKLDSYPEKCSLISPFNDNMEYDEEKIFWNSDEDYNKKIFNHLESAGSTRVGAAYSAFAQGFKKPVKVSGESDFYSLYSSGKELCKVPPGKYDFRGVKTLAKNLIIGRHDTFSYVRFNELKIDGKNTVIRLYPGMYRFDKLLLDRSNIKLLLDTTTGPVFLLVEREFEIKQNDCSLLVFKDSEYSSIDYTSYENKIDLSRRNRENPLVHSELNGRKIAQVCVGRGREEDDDVRLRFQGKRHILGALAVGAGGGAKPSLPNKFLITEGSEVMGKVKVGKLSTNFSPQFNSTPTTGQIKWWIWLAEEDNEVDLDSGFSSSHWMGSIIVFRLDGEEDEDEDGFALDWKGSDIHIYGTLATPRLHRRGSYLYFTADSRLKAVPPQRLPASHHLKYIRRLK